MDKESLKYLEDKVVKGRNLQNSINKLNRFMELLEECKEKEEIKIILQIPGYKECSLSYHCDHPQIVSEFILKHFYQPIKDAAHAAKDELEQEFEKL